MGDLEANLFDAMLEELMVCMKISSVESFSTFFFFFAWV
jgi:hypothetical protein